MMIVHFVDKTIGATALTTFSKDDQENISKKVDAALIRDSVPSANSSSQ